MRQIQSALPREWIRQINKGLDFDSNTNADVYSATHKSKFIPMQKLKSHITYSILRDRKTQCEVRPTVWRNCDLDPFWRSVNTKPLDRKIADLDWKIVNSVLPTAVKLKKWKLTTEVTCRTCRQHKENTQHIFYNCEYAKTLWQHIHNTTKKLVPDLDLSYENIVLGKDLDTKEVKQRLTKYLIDPGKKTIWCFRNMYFHDDPIKAKCIEFLSM